MEYLICAKNFFLNYNKWPNESHKLDEGQMSLPFVEMDLFSIHILVAVLLKNTHSTIFYKPSFNYNVVKFVGKFREFCCLYEKKEYKESADLLVSLLTSRSAPKS